MQTQSLIVIFLTLALGVWLNRVHGSLDHLTLGWVRRLDATRKRRLVERAESWLAHREPYRIAVRMLMLANLAALAMTIERLLLAQLYSGWLLTFGCALFATVLFVAAIEGLDHTRQGGPHWRLLAYSMPVVRGAYLLFYPIVKPVCYLRAQTKAWSEDVVEEDRATTEDEILSLVEDDAHEEAGDGTLEPSERRMIRGIFDLEKTIVREIMTPRVDIKSLPVTASITAAKRFIVECKHSRVPIYRDSVDDIVGIVLAKDLLDEAHVLPGASLESVMHDPYFVPETKEVKALLEEFKQARLQIAVVIDEYGGTAGLVSIEDVLEEIVGEIQDEYDTQMPVAQLAPAADGSLEVEARTPIDEINDALGCAISRESGVDTIGGYVNSALGRIPKPRETLTIGELEIHILAADERKIARLRLKRLPATAELNAHE